MGYRIGLDTGGTFTDAVLVDDAQRVLATAKRLTRHDDLLVGLSEALDAVLDAVPGSRADAAAAVSLVSLSTTLATNALVEGRGRPVGLVLIGLDERRLGRARLDEALAGDPCVALAGGHDARGEPIAPLDETALAAFVERTRERVDAWAISALFATRNPAHEQRARELIASLDGRACSLGHTLSAGLDAPRRALTALLNARLVPLIGELIAAARALLAARGVTAPLMVVKGDGSLLSADAAARSPVETILSGPAASLVGARFLCGEAELLVSDTGGTTTDTARVVGGEPKLVADGATVGGWRTMVKAVDVRTVALGGDGEIDVSAGRFRLGTRRVVPLSLLATRWPNSLDVLEGQLRAARSDARDARFALIERAPAGDTLHRLGSAERSLLARLADGPLALAALFAERSRERALASLEQAGIVRLAAFTPSDASHLLGRQRDWERRGAELGARLLMRGAAAWRGVGRSDWSTPEAFADAVSRHVSERVAFALADAALTSESPASPALDASQRALVARGFAIDGEEARAERSSGPSSLTVRLSLDVPIVGLGGPAASCYGRAAALLGSRALLPEHGAVANALGAVVGLVRQEASVTLTEAGGGAVRALLAGGPIVCEGLEEGVRIAEREARARAAESARAAGIGGATFQTRREDVVVERHGLRTFLECRVTVTAIGRPVGG